MQPDLSQKGNQSIDLSRGGLTTKIHVIIDGMSVLAYFSLTGSQNSNTVEAFPLLSELKPLRLTANKAYVRNAILQYLKLINI